MVILSPLKRYGKKGLAVHWLSSQLWCEKQLEYTLKFGRKPKAEETIGKDRHRTLHEQIAELIPVQPRTIADRVALRLNNLQECLKMLFQQGLTRELPIFGMINGIFIKGIIDELVLKNGVITLIDHKTRRSNTKPRNEQIFPSEFQLMLYFKLLEDGRVGTYTQKNLFDLYNFDSTSKISFQFKQELLSKGLTLEPSIRTLAKTTFDLLTKTPPISKELTIRYEHQATQKFIGNHIFNFDTDKFSENMNFVQKYWFGKRIAMKVGKTKQWKCHFCDFKLRCISEATQTTLF